MNSALGIRAYARRKCGDLPGARRLLEEIEPAGCERCAAERSWRLAELLRSERSPEEALRLLEAQPGDIATLRGHLAEPADFLSTRGKALWDLGRREEAVRDFAAALELRDPESHLAEIGTYNLSRAIGGCGAKGRKQARAYVRILRQKLKHKNSPAGHAYLDWLSATLAADDSRNAGRAREYLMRSALSLIRQKNVAASLGVLGDLCRLQGSPEEIREILMAVRSELVPLLRDSPHRGRVEALLRALGAQGGVDGAIAELREVWDMPEVLMRRNTATLPASAGRAGPLNIKVARSASVSINDSLKDS